MEQAAALPLHYTVAEYLDLEEVSEVRHEFYRGEIFAMSGAVLAHNRIIHNGSAVLHQLLGADDCEVFISGALLKVDESCFLYPDLTVSCHPDDLAADRILAYPRVKLSSPPQMPTELA